jgi:pimeloyl-ACP methyl ester carboxylesterase
MEVSRDDGSVIAVEVAGQQGATPVLFCHGLADSRLSAHLFAPAARELGLCLVAQDLRVLTRPWGFDLGAIKVPTSIHHGDADTVVPAQHARLFAEAIPGAQLHLHPGHGHFSILDGAWEVLAMLAASQDAP